MARHVPLVKPMGVRVPRLVSVVLIGLLIGWAVCAPVLAYVAGHTDGYVVGVRDVQKVIHEEAPPAYPVFPPPPRHLRVNDPTGDPNGLQSGPSAVVPDKRPLHL
jgi:hypothetical protein